MACVKAQHAQEAARRTYQKSKALAAKAGRGTGRSAARAWGMLTHPARWVWRAWYAFEPSKKIEIGVQAGLLFAAIGIGTCQLRLMRETTEAAERAWLLPVANNIYLDRARRIGCPIEIGTIVVPLHNFGKGPAFDITSSGFIFLGTGYPEKARHAPVKAPEPDSYLLPPGGDYEEKASTCFMTWDANGHIDLKRSRAFFKAAFRLSGGVRIQSRVSYRDQFRKERHTLIYLRLKRSRSGAFGVTLEGQGQHAD